MAYENYDLSFPDQPVVDKYLPIWATLPAFRAKPAFIWTEPGPTGPIHYSSLTYSELNRSVETISFNLLQYRQKGDVVIILSPPGLELVELIFACQRAGLVSIPISPPDPCFSMNDDHHFVRVLSQTKPKAAIAHSSYIKDVQNYLTLSSSSDTKLLPLLKSLVWLSNDEIRNNKEVVLEKSYSSNYYGCKPEDVYLIQYTSGATSIPKPVLVTAGSAAHNVRVARKCYDLHPNSVITSWLPQYHDCGLMFLLLTVVSGATCVLTSPKSFVSRPRLWLELITLHKATCTPVPSFALPLVVKRGGINKGTIYLDLSSMKNLILINEPIYKASIEEFVDVFSPVGLNHHSVSPSYGLAENCTFVSTACTTHFSKETLPCYKKLLPSARLGFDNNEVDNEINIVIVNEHTNEVVDDGVEGEIFISSPSNALGYLGHPSLTRQTFRNHIKNVLGRPFLRTGDRGVIMGQDRYVFVMGRCSDILFQNGKEFHPHYIETTAYKSFSRFLRGGCITAFEISSKIALVAEIIQGVEEIRVLRGICKGIREAIMKEDGVDVEVLVLVKSGDVPKTTSGKVQRWLAKHKLVEGEMNVIMQMQFGDHKNEYIQGFEKEEEINDSRSKVVDQGSGRVYLSHQSKVSTRLSLLSSL